MIMLLVDIIDNVAYFMTNDSAPNYKLIKVVLDKQPFTIETVINESKDVLNGISAIKTISYSYQQDVKSKLYLADKTEILNEIKLPAIGTITDISTFLSITMFILLLLHIFIHLRFFNIMQILKR